MKTRTAWVITALAMAVVLGSLAWATRTIMAADSARHAMLADAALQERLRLALWRMESIAATLAVEEGARPASDFRSFIAPWNALANKGMTALPRGEVLTPSPLLAGAPPRVLLHFELLPDGSVRSPQVPEGAELAGACGNGFVSVQSVAPWQERLVRLRSLLGQRIDAGPAADNSLLVRNLNSVPLPENPAPAQQIQAYATNFEPAQQMLMNEAEANARANVVRLQSRSQAPSQAADPIPDAAPENFRAVLVGGELLLTRRLGSSTAAIIQGAWLDRQRLVGELLDAVRDLFPEGRLTLTNPDDASHGSARLASLPLAFDPGPAPLPPQPAWSPLHASVLVAWVCAGLGLLALALVLHGMAALGERRAAFVSSVTHELRTPLHTFRLYSEMLADGMVPDPDRRQACLETLTREASRLSHLVENVLAFSRIEHSRRPAPAAPRRLGTVLADLLPRLEDHAARRGAALHAPALEPDVADAEITADPGALDQILFNLVDNACKYGRPPDGAAAITLTAAADHRRVTLTVSDAGPGIARREASRLFRPFHKSARDAAHSAPGVGLGLSLCRRLARALGGDLAFSDASPRGAAFRLTLPRARPHRG